MKANEYIIKSLLVTVLIIGAISSSSQLFGQSNSFNIRKIGHGTPIILIPGYASAGTIWNETIADLDTSQFECHVLSLAGFGGVEGIKTESYLKRIAGGIEKYVEKNKLEKPVLIGHSLGGLIALIIGSERSDLLSSIIVVDTWPFTPAAIDPKATIENQKPFAESYFSYDTIPLGISYSQSEGDLKPYLTVLTGKAEKIDLLVEMTLKSDERTCKQAMYEMFTVDTRDKLNNISIPVLILGTWFAYRNYGITHASMSNAFHEQYSNLQDKEIYVHSDARHFIMWDAPDWFQYHLTKFLSKDSLD